MKAVIIPVVALAAALVVSAQSSLADDVTTVTEYYDDCSTSVGPEYSATVTGTIVSTYCPKCTESMISSALSLSPSGPPTVPSAGPSPGILTTYTTVFSQFCSTGGLEPVTYTVTESCSSLGASRGPTYVPQGFVVTTVECHVCENGPTVTITTPIATPSTAASAPAPYVPPPVSTAPAAAPGSPAISYAAPAGSPATGAPVVTGTITVESNPAGTGAPAVSAGGEAPPVAAPSGEEAPTPVLYMGPTAGSSGFPARVINTTISPPIIHVSGSISNSVALLSAFIAIAFFSVFQFAI
ncbi:hypothetical protein MMC13_000453 [Lambiella insularis]|nr:hypothetical protein [Lambiella insularis]